jgi:hypothetical protein
MKYIILFLCISLASAASKTPFLNLELSQEKWIGLGFYLAPYPVAKEPFYYNQCYSDPKLFGHLPYQPYKNTLLAAVKWEKELLMLKSPEGQQVYCKPDSNQIIPELVFYKDLVEAKKQYSNRTVWALVDRFKVFNANGNHTDYKLEKLAELQVTRIELAPVSNNKSIRIFVKNSSSMEGFFDCSYTHVNQTRPWVNFHQYVMLENPVTKLGITREQLQMIRAGKVKPGMSMELVQMSLGKPEKAIKNSQYSYLTYRSQSGRQTEYVFFKNKLIEIQKDSQDEFPPMEPY